MANPPDGSFDRDFGYLIPFLDKVEKAGASLTAPGAREEFARLFSGEKARWLRMRELLSGGTAKSGGAPRGALPPAQSQAEAAASGRAAPDQALRGFTIGSMRK